MERSICQIDPGQRFTLQDVLGWLKRWDRWSSHLLAEKWTENVIDVNSVNDWIMFVKLLLGKSIVVLLSVYAPQQGLPDSEKDAFQEELLLTLSAMEKNEIIMLCGDMNGHIGRSSSDYEGVHGGNDFGTRNSEGGRILELGDAMDMIVCNTFFQKRDSRLITYFIRW